MATRNVTIEGKVQKVASQRPPATDLTIKIFDYYADKWLAKTTKTDGSGEYSLSVDLKTKGSGQWVSFFVDGTDGGCTGGRRRRTNKPNVEVDFDVKC